MTILDQIVASKRRQVAATQERVAERELERRLADSPPVRGFRAALLAAPGMAVIAEVKKASPSAGVLRADFDPVAIARAYAAYGATCLSVLTDEPYFQGRLDHLQGIRAAVDRPLLRKDFLLERYQLLEARVAGADAVLLIAECLPGDELGRLLRDARTLRMDALVELHDAAELPRVLATGADLIGINNRDLRTFVTRIEYTLELAPRVPAERCLVSESGIKTRADLDRLAAAGVRAVLVGESLVRAPDVGAALTALLSEPRPSGSGRAPAP
jgi:indole-3-glycerol phosphate synthase